MLAAWGSIEGVSVVGFELAPVELEK